MDSSKVYQPRWAMVLVLSLLFIKASRAGPSSTYCSSENTAGDSSPSTSEYMSAGFCSDNCQGSFAFAVVQGNNCWCSNLAPANILDWRECNEPCPGTGDEWCGSAQANLFGYFQLPGGKPLGTSGSGESQSQASSTPAFTSVSTFRTSSVFPSPVPSSSTSTPPPRPSSSPVVTLVSSQSSVQVDTSTSSPRSTYIPPSSTEEPSSSYYSPPPPSSSAIPSSTVPPSMIVVYTSSYYSPPPPSSSPSPTPDPSETEIYTSVTTVTGQVRTVVVTPTADATLGQSSTSGSKGVSAGKVAGIVVGIVLGLGLIVGAIIWFCMRRRRKQRDNSSESSFTAERLGPGGNAVPSRQVSQMSSAGLLNKAPRIQTNFYPNDNNDLRSAGTTSSHNNDRRSLTTDQRLNPWALYTQEERLSNVSLQDNQDYSRQLKIANPD